MIYSSLQFQSPYFGVFNEMLSGNFFWGTFFMIMGLSMVPSYLEVFVKTYFYPTSIDIVREESKENKLKNKPDEYRECRREEHAPGRST
jgi:hypothetical protein